MPAEAHIAEERWESVKHVIFEHYSEGTANKTRDILREQYGFETTIRKLKIKFEAWGFGKKIPKKTYAAMGVILSNEGPVDFMVPKMQGTVRNRVTPTQINKENKRKMTTATKKEQPSFPIPDYETAKKLLRDEGITWPSSEAFNAQSSSAALNPQTARKRIFEHDARDDEYEDHDDDNSFVASDQSMEDADLVVDGSRRLNMQNFQPQSHHPQTFDYSPVATTLSPSSSNIPFESAWLADLHTNIFPQRPAYKLISPPVRYHEHFPRVSEDSLFNAWDFTDYFGINIDPTSSISDGACHKIVTETLTYSYRAHDQHGHRGEVLRFAACYISKLLTNNITCDEYHHPSRQEARRHLNMMLDRQNMELLPACYWIAVIVMSYDKSELLLSFFEDCIESIDSSSSYLAKVLQPWIRVMILWHQDLDTDYKPTSPKMQRESLDRMALTFDASSGLQQSINILEQYGHLDSTTGLIISLYRAWNLGRTDVSGGLVQLLDCLCRSEIAFGDKHLVTIQCASMVADAYTQLNQPHLAEYHIEIVLLRLKPSSRMLEAVYYRSLLVRARYWLRQGQFGNAYNDLQLVLTAQSRILGAGSALTWETGKELFKLLRLQGRAAEADQREAELRSLHQNEWDKLRVRRTNFNMNQSAGSPPSNHWRSQEGNPY